MFTDIKLAGSQHAMRVCADAADLLAAEAQLGPALREHMAPMSRVVELQAQVAELTAQRDALVGIASQIVAAVDEEGRTYNIAFANALIPYAMLDALARAAGLATPARKRPEGT